MSRRIEFALPVKAKVVPSGPDWLHEIKHDGYRMMIIREGKRVRLKTKNGHDWTERYPLIVEAALKLRQDHFELDGEAVLLGVDGRSDFDGLHSRRYDDEVQFYAFDMLAGGGDDHRRLPLSLRKQNLAALLARRPEGIHAAPFEQGEIGVDLFRHACLLGLEGLVSKHVERAYRTGRCDHWRKVKNPKHPAYRRVRDQF
ncbi:RNA ligase family protein [Bradyrhizobium zhanjiangense]|uniref:DNA ligase n=1 Tax=Bradyrhizobium zhanjiangense TaxID=1325107 RepID=A0ABY0DG01_9BRAD|nr:RNA ligase family protein [Bradyrhizobium zhanjiangense]RXG91619.1 DNA ligase [Bradyrhizobium zhanjiangense]